MASTVIAVMMAIVSVGVIFGATPTITDVTAQQRYPWNGKVDISYTVTGNIAEEAKQRAVLTSLKVMAIDVVANTTNTATQLSGDLSLEEGPHAIVWDMDAEGLSFQLNDVVFQVSCEMTNALYCVIDLSAGSTASFYPVTYLAEPPIGGFNVDEYKTTKLVLKRIEAGTFIMGSDQTDESHRVMLTKPFFCGIFEMTQKQYQQIMGSNPSTYKGDLRPVDGVSYNMIRGSSNGAKWPSSSAVDVSSFLGKLRTRTSLDFDIPTNAQWEYACRAGTKSQYNNGGDTENDLKELGRYVGNQLDGKGGYSSAQTTVGSYHPNDWGLYDTHGNVWEWCLDWYGTLTYGNDPTGSSSGSKRMLRGGTWKLSANRCTPSDKGDNVGPSTTYDDSGFRIVKILNSVLSVEILCSGISKETILPMNLDTVRIMDEKTQQEYALSYSVMDGMATIWAAAPVPTGDLSIPEEIKGYPVTRIEVHAFAGCEGLTSITIPESVTRICDGAFQNCGQLTKVIIPNSVTNIGQGILSGCNRLQYLVLPFVGSERGNFQKKEAVFGYVFGSSPVDGMYETTQTYAVNERISRYIPEALTQVEIADETYIAKGAFDNCHSITNLKLNVGITNVGEFAFAHCHELKGMVLPNSVTDIGFRAFDDCRNVSYLMMPSDVTYIGENAFYGCLSLQEVTVPDNVGLFVGKEAFNDVTAVRIGDKEGYFFGGWTNVTGVILSDPFHSPTAVTVSPRWMSAGAQYAEHLIFFEDFERASMEFDLATVGTFRNPASIQDSMGVDGSRGFGFGRSSVTGSAHLNYVNTLVASFNARYFISRVEFDEMERYGNWGSCGSIIINRRGDEQLENNDFCKVPANDKVADKEYRHRSIEIGMMATNISFQVSDITDVSEEFMDNVKIYGRLARRYAVAFDANGGVGEMTAQTVIEGDALVLASNIFVRAGYKFQGWSAKADGNAIYADGVTIPDVPANLEGTRFYAVWKPCAPNVVPADDATFTYASATVSFSHDANDVTIFYTTDGNNPAVNGREYKGEFAVYKSCTIRAVAYGAGQYSDEVSVMLTRSDNLGEAANLYGYLLETDENNPWMVDATVSHDGSSSVKSGAIGNKGNTYLAAAVRKAGTVSFWWRAQCEASEEEDGETCWYDYGSFFVDDVVKARIAGRETGWQFVSVDVPNGGKHVLRWEYCKDGATTYQPDCIWLDQVQWVPADGSGYTLTSPEPVPYSWLRQYNLGVLEGDFEAAANAASSKMNWGRPTCVWEEYVAGVDPTNAASIFMAKIEMKDGAPVVTWEPDLNTNGIVRTYKVYGSETLENGGNWQYPTNSLHRFFKVTVEMP